MKKTITIFIVLIMSLAGCGLKTASEPVVQDKTNTARKVESNPAPATDPGIDPVKAAEAEKFLGLGLRLYEQYNYRKAVANFDKAIAANPANYKVYTAKGIALCFEGDYKNGIALIQKTLDMNPAYVPAFYDMAMAYKLQDQYDESLYWFEKTIQGDPKNTWSYYGIATIYADRGKAQEAFKYLKRAIELDPVVKEVAKEQAHWDQLRHLPEFQAMIR